MLIKKIIKLLFVVPFLLGLSLLSKAADCDPFTDPECDIDVPLDSHILVLMLIVSLVALYSLYYRKKAVL